MVSVFQACILPGYAQSHLTLDFFSKGIWAKDFRVFPQQVFAAAERHDPIEDSEFRSKSYYFLVLCSTLEGTPSPAPPARNSESQSPEKPAFTPQSTGSAPRWGGGTTPGSAGSSSSTSSRFGGGDKCFRCNKTVYAAEVKEGPKNQKYHRPCFTCYACAKSLDLHYSVGKG